MSVLLQLDQMTLADKLRAMEALWEDLCRNEESVPVPQWHKEVLDERERLGQALRRLLAQGSILGWEPAQLDLYHWSYQNRDRLDELSALLDQPHTADVRALETSQFHVADAADLLAQDPIALLYVAVVLARRLDGANQALIELKSQVQAGQPPSVIGKTVEKMEGLLGDSGASLYAGDPYDSYA